MNAKLSLSLKEAGPGEIPEIIALANQIWPITYRDILSPEQVDYMMNLFYIPQAIKIQMDEGHQFLLVENSGSPLGFASYSPLQEPGQFKLHKIYVLPELQGMGVGKFLLNSIIDRIRRQAGTALLLNVNRYNKARQFYEKQGFQVIHEEDIAIGNNFFMNDFVMEKKL